MLLAIETSSLVSSVALLHDDTLRAELTIQARLTHSEQLMPHIADMLDKASVKKSQIDGVAVAVGPGSFTGLRIGLATAKGLSFAWNVPIVGVTTPVSLAWNFVGVSDRICTLIDAQKGNVYAGVYRWDRTKLTTEKEIYIAPRTEVLDTLEREGQPVVFCGDGSLKGRRDIEGRSPLFRMAPPTMVIPRAGSVALAANVRFAAGDYDDCMTLPQRSRSALGKTPRRCPMSVTVRQACREDLPDIIAIEEASFSVPWSHQSLAAELDNPIARYYVLEKEDGSVAGYADVWLIADEGQLANIAIHPSARGLGYGEILLRTAMEALFREGCTSFFLEVRQSNAPAQGLYRKLGYEALAVRKDYYSQPVEDACIMHCQKEKYQWLGHSL